MSDFVSVAGIEDELTECPVCKDQFDEAVRIPRQMSCCMKSICQPCLQQLLKVSNLTNLLSCPMCRQKNQISNGLETFPKARVVLKILDHLKLQKRIRLSCTDCPESSPAGHQCDNCKVFLCTRCREAHERNIITKHHSILSLEDMRGRPLNSFSQRQKCLDHPEFSLDFFCLTCSKLICVSCPIVNHKPGSGHVIISIDEAHKKYANSTEDILAKLDKKKDELVKTQSQLSKSSKNFQTSLNASKGDINKTFDNMIEKLQKRRTALLRKIDDQAKPKQKRIKIALDSTSSLIGRVTSTTDYIKNLRSKASKLEDLQLLTSSTQAMKTILEEKTENVQYGGGVEFVPTNMNKLLSCIEDSGSVKTVPFKSVPTMTLSSEKVHKWLQVVDEERELTDRESRDINRPDRFMKLSGTCSSPFSIPTFPSSSTSLSPSPSPSTSLSPSPSLPSTTSYWETNFRLTYEGEGWLQLQVGVVEGRENLDVGSFIHQLPRSVCVSVENCFFPRPSLYVKVWRTDQEGRPYQVGESVTLSPPTIGTELFTFTFGLLLDVGLGRIAFIDVRRGELLARVDQKFTADVYPMYYMFSPKPNAASMRLISGSDIMLTDKKIALIQQTLSN